MGMADCAAYVRRLMLLHFEYAMTISFSQPVTDHAFSLICTPRDTCRQKVEELEISVSPEVSLRKDTDGFGNRMLYGKVKDSHNSFSLNIKGSVQTGIAPHEEYNLDSDTLVRFTVQSPFTRPGENIEKLFTSLSSDEPAAVYDQVHHYMRGVHNALSYIPGTTMARTKAEEACAIGSGVCQDYAHILISLLRMRGIPARYTVGIMEGEGASHAWVEANCNGYWYGFDPTNNRLADDSYIKISHGRDFDDCIISRGVFTNPNAVQSMEIKTNVWKGTE